MAAFDKLPSEVLLHTYIGLTQDISIYTEELALYKDFPTRLKRAQLRLQTAQSDCDVVEAEILRRMGEITS